MSRYFLWSLALLVAVGACFPVISRASIQDEPVYYFYSSAQKYCSITSGSASRAVDYPADGYMGTEPIGIGQCQSKRKNCVGPNNPAINDNLAESTGKKIVPTEKHTGDTAFCNEKAVEVNIGCARPYAVDANPNDPIADLDAFDQKRLDKWPKGNYCRNTGNSAGNEKDNKCSSGNTRSDTGWPVISAALGGIQVVNITESGIDAWMDNDVFDPDGSRANFKGFATINQNWNNSLYSPPSAGGEVSNQNWDDLLDIKRQYLDKGDAVVMLFYFSKWGFVLGGHAVVLTGAEISGDKATLTIADSNFPGGATTLSCEKNLLSRRYKCSSENYDSFAGTSVKINVEEWNFLTDLTNELRAENERFCIEDEDTVGMKGDLCSRRGQFGKWIKDNSMAFGTNFGSRGSWMGNCFGWSDSLLRIAYLANFVGENSVKPAQGCASAIAGENQTAWCFDNKTACRLSMITETYKPKGKISSTKMPVVGFCAYKNDYSGVPGGNIITLGYSSNQIVKCNNEKQRIAGTDVPDQFFPVSVYVIGEDAGGAAKPRAETEKENKFVLAIKTLPSRLAGAWRGALALVGGDTRPDCVSLVTLPSGHSLSFTYQNGLTFIHPSAYENAPAEGSDLVKQQTTIWGSDFIYVPGSDYVWRWENNGNVLAPIELDGLSAGYLRQLEQEQSEDGITTSCRLTGALPARFQQFLTKVGATTPKQTDITVKVVGPGTVVFGGNTLKTGQSLKLPVSQGKPIPLVAQTNPTKTYQVSEIALGIPRTLYYRGVEWQGSGCRDFQFTCSNTGGVTTCEATTTSCYLTPAASSTVTVIFREVSMVANVDTGRIKTADLEIKSLFSNKPNNVVPENGAITVSSGIRNLGTQATTTKLIWYLDGVVIQSKQGVLSVPATTTWQTGAKTNSLTDIYLPWEILRMFKPGLHSLTLKADPDNLIKEVREDNNQASLTFTLPGTPVADALRLTAPTAGAVLPPSSPLVVTWSGNVPQVILLLSRADGSNSQYLTPETDPVTHRHGLPAQPATYTTTTPATPGDYLVQIFKFNALAPTGTGAETPISSVPFSVIGTSVISSFTVSPPQGLPGRFTFRWTVSSATSCTLDSIGGPYLSAWPTQTFDPRTEREIILPLQVSSDFRLTCTNGQTETQKTVSVYVNGSWKPDATAGSTADSQTGIARLLSLVSDWPDNTKVQGENITLRAVLENTGNAPASNVRLDWYYDGRLIKSPVITIPANSRYENKAEVAMVLPKPSAGVHRVRLFITYNGQKQDQILNFTVTAPTSFLGNLWASVVNAIKNPDAQ